MKDVLPLDSRKLREDILISNESALKRKFGPFCYSGNSVFTLFSDKNQDFYSFDKNSRFVLILSKKNEINFTNFKENFLVEDGLRLLNSYVKNILKNEGYLEYGTNKRYFNPKLYQNFSYYNINLFEGISLKADVFERGLSLVSCPTNKIIRSLNLWEEFEKNIKHKHFKV